MYIITRLDGGLGYTWSDTDLEGLEAALLYGLADGAYNDQGRHWAKEKIEQIQRLRQGRR